MLEVKIRVIPFNRGALLVPENYCIPGWCLGLELGPQDGAHTSELPTHLRWLDHLLDPWGSSQPTCIITHPNKIYLPTMLEIRNQEPFFFVGFQCSPSHLEWFLPGFPTKCYDMVWRSTCPSLWDIFSANTSSRSRRTVHNGWISKAVQRRAGFPPGGRVCCDRLPMAMHNF